MLCLLFSSSMLLFRQADINQHPRSSNIISSCPSLLTSLKLNLILGGKKTYISYEWGGGGEIGLVAILVNFSFLSRHTKKTAGGKYFDMQQIFHHCLKTVWSPKPEKTSVLIQEKFTSKQKKEGEERREVTLLHNPVKSLLSE